MPRRPLFPTLLLLVLCASGCGGCNGSAREGGSSDDGGPGAPSDAGVPDAGSIDSGTPHVEVGPGDFSLDGGPAGTGSGVKLGPDGGLVLDSSNVNLHYAWIANASAGTVSKFDTRSGCEVARYYSVIPLDGLGNELHVIDGSQGNSPSRTAIDLNGDVWIANRAPGIQGSVTKIANDLASCRHSLPDGGVHTSIDFNNNCKIDTNPSAGEFIIPTDFTNPKQYDDCVLFSTPLCSTGSDVKARALAVAAPPLESNSAGDIWVGCFQDRAMMKLDSRTGQQVAVGPDAGMSIPLPSFGPYGAAVDSQQRLWVASYPQQPAAIALIDAITGRLVNGDIVTSPHLGTTSSYGIAIDGKDRVWLATWGTGAGAYRYDHGPGLDAGMGFWTRFDFPNARSQIGTPMGDTRGIAADDQGYIWASGNQAPSLHPTGAAAQLIGFNGDDGGIFEFHLPDGGTADFIDATDPSSQTYQSIGVGLDSDDNIWVDNYGGSTGNAMRISRDGGTIFLTPSQPGNMYTYSDFTGYQLRHFTASRGTYFHDFTGCGPATIWGPVTWDAVTPPGTSLQLFVSVAATMADLNNTALTQYGPYASSPANLSAVPRGAAIRVKFVLGNTDHKSTPTLYDFNIDFRCPTLN